VSEYNTDTQKIGRGSFGTIYKETSNLKTSLDDVQDIQVFPSFILAHLCSEIYMFYSRTLLNWSRAAKSSQTTTLTTLFTLLLGFTLLCKVRDHVKSSGVIYFYQVFLVSSHTFDL
jgi:hypothetical protein